MTVVDLLNILARYPYNMEVLVYDSEVKKSIIPQVALRTTKAGVELEPPALIIYPDARLR